MNQFFYEQRSREKLKDLRAEGLRSQAFHRSGAAGIGPLHGLWQFLLGLLAHRTKDKERPEKKPKSEAAYSRLP